MGTDVVVQLERGDVGRPPTSATPKGRRPIPADWIAVGVLLALFPVVHDVKTMLTAGYWLDEAWVALSVRLPLSDLPVATSSTPLGWSFLLRLVPDADYLRVVPLAFHGLTMVAAYALGRLLRWPTRWLGVVAGVACATAVLLVPAQQIRHDLKQYTADAAITVVLVALAAWTEQTWSRRRLGVLAAVAATGIAFSHVTAIAAPCVFGGLLLATALRRRWARLRDVAVAAFAAMTVIVVFYFGVSARGNNDKMREYWADSFPSLTELPGYLSRQVHNLAPMVGAPALVIGCLFLAGVITLARQGRPASAIAVLLLPVGVTTLGVARFYPLLELRTSHFLLVTTAAVAGVGVAGLAYGGATLARRGVPRLPATALTAAACAVLLALYGLHNGRWYRFDGDEPGLYYTAIAVTDIRSATQFVATHRSANDVIVMNELAWYGFAYYSPQDQIELVTPHTNTVGWWIRMPTRSDVTVIYDNEPAALHASLDQALTLADQRGGGRVWLIRSHAMGEADAWQQVLADYRVEEASGGVEPVLLIGRK
ncbi:hypothetical protein ACQPWW_06370 [Micromonospora sp. CA-240977]|uniref:hypothetical protein n=1 Tax=Micromonospora sp. CA-240977 TaxID=3239957 RepID=UPI003D9236F8